MNKPHIVSTIANDDHWRRLGERLMKKGKIVIHEDQISIDTTEIDKVTLIQRTTEGLYSGRVLTVTLRGNHGQCMNLLDWFMPIIPDANKMIWDLKVWHGEMLEKVNISALVYDGSDACSMPPRCLRASLRHSTAALKADRWPTLPAKVHQG